MSSPCQHIVLAKLCVVVQGREQLCISHTEQTVEINKLIKKKKKDIIKLSESQFRSN